MNIVDVCLGEPAKKGARARFCVAMVIAGLLAAAWLFIGGSPDQRSVSASPPPSCYPAPPDMISWWPGDGDAFDIAGANNGSFQGGAVFGAGKVAQGFALNGTDAGISVPDAASLDFGPGEDFSIDAWVRSEVKQTPTLPGLDIQTIVDKRHTPNSSTARGYTLFLNNGRIAFQLADENNYLNFPPAGPDLRDGQFHLVAVTVDRDDPSGGQLYVDGISVSTFDPTVRQGDLTNAQPLLIGIHAQTGLNGYFQGVIDEVEIFSRELSSGEVQAIYAAGSEGKCKPGAIPTPTPVSDMDGDAVPDASDNCPTVFNNDQADTDNDGIGNACDTNQPPPSLSGEVAAYPPQPGSLVVTPTGPMCTTYEFSVTTTASGPYQGTFRATGTFTLEPMTPDPPNSPVNHRVVGWTETFTITQPASMFPPQPVAHVITGTKQLDPTANGPGINVAQCSATLVNPSPVVTTYQATITGLDGVFPDSGTAQSGMVYLPFDPGAASFFENFYSQPVDPDADGDGVPDATDNCPAAANANQLDTDQDGMGDACDSDDDNDGVVDISDNCPLTSNPSQANLDGDAFGDVCDPDDDNDGVADGVDNCPTGNIGWTSNGGTDYDHDGCRDAGEDTDDDADGVTDGGDSCPLGTLGWTSNSATDVDHDGCQDSGEDTDDDNDGYPDGADNCPLTANASQVDTDGDGTGDACDFDDDNDGVSDISDNCPLTFNPSQANLDGDAFGDICDPDDDNDGDLDGADNCPITPNSNQSDVDHDGIGDVCDPINELDLDDDGIPNVVDNCPLAFNPNQADTDGDGIGNVCDTNANDGPLGDIDGDGVRNNLDNCLTTPNGDQRDTNTDGVGDLCTPFDYATGGQFVIGNLVNMSSLSNVYFWGSQWRQNNPMSGGSAPSAFKGFENGLALPACGSTWTSRPGNSSNPPSMIPTNIAVIVSSSVTQSGSTISGNVKKIVVVRTNPGYGPSPGHPGTGKVIAILCSTP